MENPYTSRNLIRDRTAFFGRRTEVEETFANLKNFQNTSVVGERRIGKSSLLWFLSRPETYGKYFDKGDVPFLFVYFDLQKVANFDQKTFFKLLFTEIARQLPKELTQVSATQDTWQERFDELVDRIQSDFRTVICLDEFETVTTNPQFDNAFLLYLRHFANLRKVAYITSSREPLEVICKNTDHLQGSDFWNIFVTPPLYLGLFKQEEATAIISQPSQAAGLSFQQDEIDFILEMAGRHPLFLQIACFCLFETKKRKLEANEPVQISASERNQVSDNFLLGATPHFEHIWTRLHPLERRIAAEFEKVDADGDLKDTIRALIKKGILVPDGPVRPFCQSFGVFAKEHFLPDRGVLVEGTSDVGERTNSEPTQASRLVPSLVPLQHENPLEAKLDVWIGRSGETLIDFVGPYSLARFCSNRAKIDQTTLARFENRVRNIPHHENWRLEKREIGQDVQELFGPIPELSQIYTGGRATYEDDERLLLTFRCSPEMLAFPFEFINSLSDVDEAQRHLVLSHPVRKSIVGIRSRKAPLRPYFYLDEKCKVLLVSSNVSGNFKLGQKTYTLPQIPAVECEVETLGQLFEEQRKCGNLKCRVETVQNISRGEMIEALQNGGYDAIHFAGHALHTESAEESSLFFSRKSSVKLTNNAIEMLSSNELNNLVGRTKLKFFYLSCCQGAETGKPEQLLNFDFLGIAHALLVGGIPSILSMRWPLSDDMAVLLAVSFYGELLNGQKLETALLRARRQVQSKMPNDYNWLSPVLVVQG